jgi:CheY-like chemotaxis protein
MTFAAPCGRVIATSDHLSVTAAAARAFRLAAMRARRLAGMLAGTMALRCLIIDDNGSFIDAATALLRREGVEVVGSATSGEGVVALLEDTDPGLVLIDVELGAESGFDVAQRVADALGSAAPPMVLISTYPASDFADLIAGSPAVGFLPKSALSARALDGLLGGSPDPAT